MNLSHILNTNQFTESTEVCPGCTNSCQVRCFRFQNGKAYYSGNNCEKVYHNSSDTQTKGVNMFEEKYKLLFIDGRSAAPVDGRSAQAPVDNSERSTASNASDLLLTIGIPRGLGIYENYPFWWTLFTHCGFRVVLSGTSSNRLYEKGIRTIIADNICFPAKLMHGHVMNLIERGVNRIFYPWVVFEKKEDAKAKNSFNCPIVSGYADVIRSSINPEERYGIPLDAPIISFAEEPLLRKSLQRYLQGLGVAREVIEKAITYAIEAQQQYLDSLERRALEVVEKAQAEGRMVILLAARPYHIDPLIQHKIADAIAAMGIDVITENVAAHKGDEVYSQVNALCQWAYPNRIFKAAYFVGNHTYKGLHMVQLTSFGCGPDAFILDEVRDLLNRYRKNLTVLKIDDVNNIGSLQLRVRSLVESVGGNYELRIKNYEVGDDNSTWNTQEIQNSKILSRQKGSNDSSKIQNSPWTTAIFEREDKERRTILIPYFAEGYNEFIATLVDMAGYKYVSLPMGCQTDAEEGLQAANNDVCYPATIVIGSLLRALKSGNYDPATTAVAITQTGGQCRASNYYSLIKNGLVKSGFAEVPVISVATGKSLGNNQPGFEIPWKQLARPALEAIFFADALAKLYYPSAPREKTKGAARAIYDHYIAEAQEYIRLRRYDWLHRLLQSAVRDFMAVIDTEKQVPVVGVVGEIYVKYNSFSNKSVVRWLIEHGVEVVPPALTGFFSTSMPNAHINREQYIKTMTTPLWLMDLGHALIQRTANRYDRLCREFPLYRPFDDIFHIYRLSNQVISPAADFGEGWFLPGEICALAESGVDKVVSLQPFGCIANHIISKGIEKRMKERYPHLSLLFLDFDSGTSEANVYNRLFFLLNN